MWDAANRTGPGITGVSPERKSRPGPRSRKSRQVHGTIPSCSEVPATGGLHGVCFARLDFGGAMTKSKPDRPPFRSIDDLPELATPEEVAEVFRCSARYIKNECTAGRMGAAIIAGKYLIAREDARTYLDRAKVTVKVEFAPRRSLRTPTSPISPEVLDQVAFQQAREAAQRLIDQAKARRRRPKDT